MESQRISVLVASALFSAALLLSWLETESPERFTLNLAATYLLAWLVLLAILKRREMASRFLLTSTSIAVLVLLFEIPAIIGLVDYRIVFRIPIVSPAHDPRNIADEELIFRRPPHDRIMGSARTPDESGFHSVRDSLELGLGSTQN